MGSPVDRRAVLCKCSSPVLTAGGRRFRCGRCSFCLASYAKQYALRARREFEGMPSDQFASLLTLTFEDRWLSSGEADAGRSAWRCFKAELCRLLRAEVGATWPRFLGVNERGGRTGRLHLHCIVFGVPVAVQRVVSTRVVKGRVRQVTRFDELVSQAWGLGFTDARTIMDAAGVGYVTHYLIDAREAMVKERRAWRRVCEASDAAGEARPAFRPSLWISVPGGRGGGLGRRFVDRVVAAAAAAGPVRGDVPPMVGAGGKRLVLSRYERDLARKRMGLDGELAKRVRRAWNPEEVEMKARVLEVGSVRALALARGHVDADAAEAAERFIASRRRLGLRL